MAAEFTCCECGRTVVTIDDDKPPELRLCFACIQMPAWFRFASLRAFLCLDHDGVEAWERQEEA